MVSMILGIMEDSTGATMEVITQDTWVGMTLGTTITITTDGTIRTTTDLRTSAALPLIRTCIMA